jgi:hypothetical protein
MARKSRLTIFAVKISKDMKKEPDKKAPSSVTGDKTKK